MSSDDNKGSLWTRQILIGLITSAAIIQSLSIYLLNEKMLSLESGVPSLVVTVLFLVSSLSLFLGRAIMVRYTFSQFQFYSALADNVTTGKEGIIETARLSELDVYYRSEPFHKEKSKLEKAYKACLQEGKLPEGTPMYEESKNRDGETCYFVNHVVYAKHWYNVRESKWWRRNFTWLIIMALLLLAFVTYYPLVANLIHCTLSTA